MYLEGFLRNTSETYHLALFQKQYVFKVRLLEITFGRIEMAR
jgi:hypothetical protein